MKWFDKVKTRVSKRVVVAILVAGFGVAGCSGVSTPAVTAAVDAVWTIVDEVKANDD